MTTTTSTTTATAHNIIRAHRDREARLITTALALVCGVGFVSAVVPGVERTITTALLIGAVAVTVTLAARMVLRWMRHRREDRADALAAAAWRAHHAPHLLASASTGARDGRAA